MFAEKVSTPIFGTSTHSSRRTSAQAFPKAFHAKQSAKLPQHNSLEDANLRLVQYEIAEREACNALSTMCLEASNKLNIQDTEYKIDDIMSGILMLGNLYKRVGNEKSVMEANVEKIKQEMETLEANKNLMVQLMLCTPNSVCLYV
jgi:hypothetical protein